MHLPLRESDVRATGRGGMGVRSIKLDEGDVVMDMILVKEGGLVLTVTEKGLGKRTEESQFTVQGRGGKGILAMKATEKTGGLACLRMTTEDEDLLLVRDDGVIMRMPVDQISIIGRNTQGVRLMSLDGDTKIASVALLPHQEILPDEEGETPAAPETVSEKPEGEE